MEALKSDDANQYKKEFLEVVKYGEFPPYALEFGRNVLKLCDADAILFVDGDAQINVIHYLQIVENYRKDIYVVALSLLEGLFHKTSNRWRKGVLKPAPYKLQR